MKRFWKKYGHLPGPRWFLWGLAGLIGAGIIHVVIVLSVPSQVPYSTHEKVAGFGPDRQFHVLPPVLPRTEPLPDLDPSMRYAICRYSMDDGPVKISVSIPSPFWSIALFNDEGQTVYSLNDRTSDDRALTMLILSKEQLSILRENPPIDLEEMIIIETDKDQGYALVRAFLPSEAYLPQLSGALEAAICTSYDGTAI
ncbi:hypothetical protein E1162_07440 [Rhodobacteraceae bacterium RKSG542]|uniref:DUF1254 domain-containing protein n=1 Tax=Pseudovibrio flavus TaxID=2529854 RepID=UPI0012BC6442|nr:hypothetical protein [Pseudovibrio flavus]MTI17071.1 hypothetical protein [Pseudovibrio flavus]